MPEERSPLDFDDNARDDVREDEGPARRRSRGGDSSDAPPDDGERFVRSQEKWRPGAQAPDRGRHGDFHAGPTKLEITTPLEWLFAGIGGGLFVIAFVLVIEGGTRSSPSPPAHPIVPCMLALAGIVFITLWCKTDNYYLTNPARKRIDYHFEFLGWSYDRPHLEGREVEIVAVDGLRKSHKPKYGPRRYWNEFTVYAWHRDGEWTQLTDAIRDDLLQANQLAREAAAALGCAFGAGQQELIYRRDGSGKVVPVDLSDDWLGLKRMPPWLAGAVALGVLSLLAAMLASSLTR